MECSLGRVAKDAIAVPGWFISKSPGNSVPDLLGGTFRELKKPPNNLQDTFKGLGRIFGDRKAILGSYYALSEEKKVQNCSAAIKTL